jgi:hypothetical protein
MTEDVYVEVTALGDIEPTFLLARRGSDVDIARARAEFFANAISVDEFELRVGEALSGNPV